MKPWVGPALVVVLMLTTGDRAAGLQTGGVQAAKDSFLTRLEGRWLGEGTVLNQPSRIEMEWSVVLGGRFSRLTFRNEMGAAPKTTVFEGQAYYQPVAEGRYRGTWFDNSGQMRPILGRRDGDALVSQWGSPDTEEGETTYRLLAEDRLEVIDRVKSKDGTWRLFGESRFSRR